MALFTPILNQVPAFDATQDYTFTFSVPSGGDEVQGNTLYIQGGEQPAGIEWIQRDFSQGAGWGSAAYGNGVYVATPFNGGQIIWSSDGANWQSVSVSGNFYETKVLFGNDKFVMGSSNGNTIAYSSDGRIWNTVSAQIRWDGFAFGDGKFVGVTANMGTVMWSADGAKWNTIDLTSQPWYSSTESIYSLSYGNDKFFTIARSGNVYLSSDGLTWERVTKPTPISSVDNKICLGTKDSLIAFYVNSNIIKISKDGYSWSNAMLPSSGIYHVYYNGKIIIAKRSNIASNDLYYSFDGVSWETATLPVSMATQAIMYDGEGILMLPSSMASVSDIVKALYSEPKELDFRGYDYIGTRYQNTIAADTLLNGYLYSAYLRTNSGDFDVQSPQSNIINFYCMNAPSFDLLNVNVSGGTVVNSSNFTVYVEYTQEPSGEDEVTDPLTSYNISLYDTSRNLIHSSGTVYTKSSDVPFTGSYDFSGLENGKEYLVRATGLTFNNVPVSTVYASFSVSYEVPSQPFTFTITNDCNNGRIRYELYSDSEELAAQYTAVKIKRKINDSSYDWVTIFEKDINNISDFSIDGYDNLAASETSYVYAWIPVINDTEGNYYTQSVYSTFSHVFVCDKDHMYKFQAGVSYGTSNQVQDVGVFAPLNRKYPIYIANAITNYQIGAFNGMIIGSYLETRNFDRKEMVNQKDELLKFLTNKRGKVLKDFNGNIWLIFVIDNPSISYKDNWGNGLMTVSFNYSEMGNPNNIADLQEAFLI